jgi:hypothetical protein
MQTKEHSRAGCKADSHQTKSGNQETTKNKLEEGFLDSWIPD